MSQIKELYEYISMQKLKVPANFKDLEEYSGTLEDAYSLLADGEIVLHYGRGFSSGSNEVLAYQKDAESKGGHVLLRNGSIKQVTPTEFKTLRK